MEFHHVGQAGIKLLTSGDPPASASQHTGITGMTTVPSPHSTIDTYMGMFIAALFTIAKIWNQPTCPAMIDWIKKMWYIYTMEYYAAIKRNEIMFFAET